MNRHLASLAIAGFAATLLLSACGGAEDDQQYPTTEEDRRKARLGKLSGEEGLTVFGADNSEKGGAGSNPLGVNSFLWRGTLDTLAFMPLISADPWGGTILTDWYEDPQAPGERFKINALILDRNLRTDSLKISVFRQKKNASGNWEDAQVDATMGRKLEDTVLTRARQLRVKQMGY